MPYPMAAVRGSKSVKQGGAGVTTYTISGTVYDADGSTAVEGATVALGALTATSAANGTYTIADVPAGTSGSMTCTKTGYSWAAKTIAAMSGNLTAVLVKVYGATEVWRLVDISSGTAIPAAVNSARNGVLQGWDLQNTAGPVTGSLAPYSGGSGDYGNIYTANLSSAWNPNAVSIFGWAKRRVLAANQRILQLQKDGDNYIYIYDTATAIKFRAVYGTTSKLPEIASTSLNWFSFALTIDKTADEMKHYLNGITPSTTGTLGTWSAAGLAVAAIGAASLVPANVWDGWIGYIAIKFGTVWTPTEIQNMHNAAATSGPF
jgi:hypothetical protein